MPSQEWNDAVGVYMRLTGDARTQANARYLEIWHTKSEDWKDKNNCGPADARFLLQAISDVTTVTFFGPEADEYEEIMQAMELMEKI